jgi:hypothetical protein
VIPRESAFTTVDLMASLEALDPRGSWRKRSIDQSPVAAEGTRANQAAAARDAKGQDAGAGCGADGSAVERAGNAGGGGGIATSGQMLDE